MLKNVEAVQILDHVNWGASVAEADSLLEDSRIETSAFGDLIDDKVDLILGTKGSGKSALFRIFTDFLPNFLLMRRKVVVAHGVQRQGDVIFQAYKEEFAKLNEDDFVDFWSIYLVSLAHEQFIKGERYRDIIEKLPREIEKFRRACQAAKIPEIKAQKTLKDILGWVLTALKSHTPKLTYNLPQDGGSIDLDLFGTPAPNQPHPFIGEEETATPVYVLDIKDSLEDILRQSNVSVWLMVDKLDELFPRRSPVESRALRGLLRAMRIFSSDRIRVKVFLRDDMLENLLNSDQGFTALTHLTARQADTLKWSEDQILHLITKRLFANDKLCAFLDVEKDRISASIEYRRECFYKVFPQTVHRGSRQSSTLRWIYHHCCDAKGVATPRDVIDLLTKAKQRRLDDLRADLAGQSEAVFDSISIQYGFEQLSIKKRQTYLQAEFPHLWPYIDKFTGGKSSLSEAALQKTLGPKHKAITQDLISIGLISERRSQGQRTFWFPYLYRKSLHLTQGSGEDDEEEK